MANTPVISVENLSKRYVIGHEARHDNLRDTLQHTARKLWRRFRWGTGFQTEEFWALRDVSFEVKQGEVVGIIGRNGAGKSTLLKILSRITEPTTGRISITGRVASLLEVGTGFHPELSGRENIFLNGAILGMKRTEIRRKFDEIVAFAEVEKFLDTPVKYYSSGMYVRLAFAVAAHLDPEILIVDEVLAVGDAEFQKKCLGKMGEVAEAGRTALFVSHNMASVQHLCTRGIVLAEGKIVTQGNTASAVQAYLHTARVVQGIELQHRPDRKGNGKLRFLAVTFHDLTGKQVTSILCGSGVSVRLHYESTYNGQIRDIDVAFNLRNDAGVLITCFANIQTGRPRLPIHARGYFECAWPKTNIRGGEYDCALYCSIDGEVCDWLQNAFVFSLEDGDFFGTGHLVPRDHGDVLCEQQWSSCVSCS